MKFELKNEWFYFKCKSLNLHKRIYVAYSGGVDSSVLLNLLNNLRKIEKFNIAAIHINHSQNKESKNWSIFCKNQCEKIKIPIYIYTNKEDKSYEKNTEEKLRLLRYIFFLKTVKKNSSLMLAHNENDNTETMLLNIFRGCGLNGLTGIREKIKLNQINLVRPFLNISKQEILEYAEKEKINYITDFSNFNDKFSRNYIRNKIICKIENKWKNFNKIIKNNSKIYKNINYLTEIVYDNFLKLNYFNNNLISIRYLVQLPSFICSEIIRIWIKKNNCLMPNSRKIKEINEIIFKQSKIELVKIDNYIIIKYKKNIYIEKNLEIKIKNFFVYKSLNFKKKTYFYFFVIKKKKICYQCYKNTSNFQIKYKKKMLDKNNLQVLKNLKYDLIFKNIK